MKRCLIPYLCMALDSNHSGLHFSCKEPWPNPSHCWSQRNSGPSLQSSVKRGLKDVSILRCKISFSRYYQLKIQLKSIVGPGSHLDRASLVIKGIESHVCLACCLDLVRWHPGSGASYEVTKVDRSCRCQSVKQKLIGAEKLWVLELRVIKS